METGTQTFDQQAREMQESQTTPLTAQPVDADTPRSRRAARRAGKSSSAFKTISEVADELNVQQHVLRFWETKFSQIRPLKRGGGRRYYRPEDLALLQRIHHLLYTEGYTIKGVQKMLREKGKAAVMDVAQQPANEQQAPVAETHGAAVPPVSEQRQRAALEAVLGELKSLRAALKSE